MSGSGPATDWPCPPFREIRTQRLHLRALRLTDAPARFAVLSDPDSMRYWWHLPHTDIAQTETHMRERLLTDDGLGQVWVITSDGGSWLGEVTLFRHSSAPGLLWLGYLLSPSVRGRGYASEAARAALGFAFGDWGAHRVEAVLDPENRASAGLLERLGFTREGHQRANFRLGDDWKDTAIFGMLASDWQALRSQEAA
jgi:[ribosomal protein S5]-alanine N-acetyltransferase